MGKHGRFLRLITYSHRRWLSRVFHLGIGYCYVKWGTMKSYIGMSHESWFKSLMHCYVPEMIRVENVLTSNIS